MSVELIDPDQHAEAERIPEVLKRLGTTQVAAEHEPRGRRDGLACFNHLYTVITAQVQRDYLDGKFSDGDFITRLDVAFANRYLRAVEAGTGLAPAPWRCLLELRSDRRISPLAYAVAGVSAHVNYDLAFAVVETGMEMGRFAPTDHDDYRHLNTIFFREMRKLRQHFEDPDERSFEKSLGLTTLENLAGDVVVVVARYIAWRKALRLWAAREDKPAYAAIEERTAKSVGAFNRRLLAFDRTVRHAFTMLLGGGRHS
ncbi:MAG TPA: DUF5995 family protein [Acidimicrobiales bacterium]|nr:DUF5995 family protein [Acidimicrobiales bacterium]